MNFQQVRYCQLKPDIRIRCPYKPLPPLLAFVDTYPSPPTASKHTHHEPALTYGSVGEYFTKPRGSYTQASGGVFDSSPRLAGAPSNGHDGLCQAQARSTWGPVHQTFQAAPACWNLGIFSSGGLTQCDELRG